MSFSIFGGTGRYSHRAHLHKRGPRGEVNSRRLAKPKPEPERPRVAIPALKASVRQSFAQIVKARFRQLFQRKVG